MKTKKLDCFQIFSSKKPVFYHYKLYIRVLHNKYHFAMEDISKNLWYLTYDEVIKKAKLIQPCFAADLQEFAAYDKSYTPKVNTNLLQVLKKSEKNYSKSNWLTEIKRITNLLDINLAEAIHCYKDLIYYVNHEFGNALINKETFGYSDFADARHSVKKMIALLNHALATLAENDHESRLRQAYMPFYLPSEMANLVTDLREGYEKLKFLKEQHLVVTRERINLYNFLWDTLSKICEDAKIIFSDDPVRLDIYDLFETEDWQGSRTQVIHLN